jgi:hypothetical protein
MVLAQGETRVKEELLTLIWKVKGIKKRLGLG